MISCMLQADPRTVTRAALNKRNFPHDKIQKDPFRVGLRFCSPLEILPRLISNIDWIKYREMGRRPDLVQDKSGDPTRRWEDEVEGQSRPSRHQSGRTHRETPRSESSSQDPRRTLERGTSSSSRRPSISSPRPSFKSVSRGDHESSQPINIINKSSSRYHDDGGQRRNRDEQRDHGAGSHNEPSSSGAGWSHRAEGATTHVGSTQESYPDPTSEDSLSKRLDGLALGEYDYDKEFEYDREYTISASAPAAHGRRMFNNEHRRRDQLAQDAFDADRSNQDKGKGISKDQHEVEMPPQKSRIIEGTPGSAEDLDKSYVVRNRDYKKFFRPGRVFCTLWTDAYSGETNTKNESAHDQFMSQVTFVRHNQRVYTKIRRFVVVRLGDRFCTCLPVTTYDGKGYRKRGINLHEHGLIYSEREPNSVDGINKQPLLVKISPKAEKLVNTSYINYARVYTVECNVKVKDVGELDSFSLRLLKKYYNEINHAPEDDLIEDNPKKPYKGDIEFKGLGAGIAGDLQDYGEHSVSSGRMLSSGPGTISSHDGYNDANRQTYSNVNTQNYQPPVQPLGHLQQGGMHQYTAYEQNPFPSHQTGNLQYSSGYDHHRFMPPQGSQPDPRFSHPSQLGGYQDSISHGAPGQPYQPVQVHYGPQLPTSYPTSGPFHGPVPSTQYPQGHQQYGQYHDNHPQQPANTSYPPSQVVSDFPNHPRDNFAPPIATTPQYPQSGNSGQYPSHTRGMDPYPPPSDQHQHSSRGHHQEPVIREDEELELPNRAEIMRNRRNSTIVSPRSHDPRSSRDRDRGRGRDYDSGKGGGRW